MASAGKLIGHGQSLGWAGDTVIIQLMGCLHTQGLANAQIDLNEVPMWVGGIFFLLHD